MATKKYASLNTLQTFLDNLKNLFATKTEVDNKSQVQVTKTNEEETTTTEHLPTLQIYRLSQAEYDEKVSVGDIDENALYLTPSNNVDLSKYAMREDVTQVQIITWEADD
jgi:hypothetical protein